MVMYSGMAGLEDVNILSMMTGISAFIKIWMFRRSGRDVSSVFDPFGGDLSEWICAVMRGDSP
ncbi:MAG: hypothetical protein ACI4Q9_05065 [Candidatus Methanomethylophilaceae archaeon]